MNMLQIGHPVIDSSVCRKKCGGCVAEAMEHEAWIVMAKFGSELRSELELD